MEVLSKHLFLHSPIKLFFRVLESAEYQNDDPYSLFCNSIFDVSFQYLKLLNMLKCWPLTLRTLRKTKPFAKKKMNEAHHLFWHVCRHLANGPVNVLLR